MFRAIFLTFLGQYRGGAVEEAHHTITSADAEPPPVADTTTWGQTPPVDADAGLVGHDAVSEEHVTHRPHESPWVMVLPLLILMVPAIFAGFLNAGDAIVGFIGFDKEVEHLLLGSLPSEVHVAETEFRPNVAIMSTIVPVAGICLAWLVYGVRVVSSSTLASLFAPLHRLLENRYYFDVIYERMIVGFVFYQVLGGALAAVDRFVVDGAVNALGGSARTTGNILRYLQSGQFQTYGALAFGGVAFTAFLVLALSPI
jgi:NADH-quinone oxidoreductase subunit L